VCAVTTIGKKVGSGGKKCAIAARDLRFFHDPHAAAA
jgi:hypothetical protein